MQAVGIRGYSDRLLVARCARFRPGRLSTPAGAAKYSLRLLARRHGQLTSEIEGVNDELLRLTSETAPALVELFGIGPDTAATLLVTAGGNPERLRSEAAFAALCGVNPVPASSGRTNRHRLNRGGDRQATLPSIASSSCASATMSKPRSIWTVVRAKE